MHNLSPQDNIPKSGQPVWDYALCRQRCINIKSVGTSFNKHIDIYYNACCASKQTLQQAHMPLMPCICLGANVAMDNLQCKNCRATIAMQKLSCIDCHARIAARDLPLLPLLLRHTAACTCPLAMAGMDELDRLDG